MAGSYCTCLTLPVVVLFFLVGGLLDVGRHAPPESLLPPRRHASLRNRPPLLNRLLALLCRSLPAYLADARPWTGIGAPRDPDAARPAGGRPAAIRPPRRRGDRATGGRPNPGHFPTEFTAKNDLALDFLFREVVAHQEHDVAMIERCAAELETAPPLHALAEEILGNARGHFDVLLDKLKDEAERGE